MPLRLFALFCALAAPASTALSPAAGRGIPPRPTARRSVLPRVPASKGAAAAAPTDGALLARLTTATAGEIKKVSEDQAFFQRLGFENGVQTCRLMRQDLTALLDRARRAVPAGAGKPVPIAVHQAPRKQGRKAPRQAAAETTDPLGRVQGQIESRRALLASVPIQAAAASDAQVKSVLLLAASDAARHLDWLTTLRGEIVFGEKRVTSRLRAAWAAGGHGLPYGGVEAETAPVVAAPAPLTADRPPAPTTAAPATAPTPSVATPNAGASSPPGAAARVLGSREEHRETPARETDPGLPPTTRPYRATR